MIEKIKNTRINQEQLVSEIREKGFVNVTFIVTSLSMWQHQGIYDLMALNPVFRLSVVYAPFKVYSQEDAEMGWESCQRYFASKGIALKNYKELDLTKKHFRPDIIFYPQWYSDIYDEKIDIQNFYDRLICLIPYAITVVPVSVSCGNEANYLAWRQYFFSEEDREDFKHMFPPYHADNIRVVGYPKSEEYEKRPTNDPWKTQICKKKRIIWAPHFTIPTANSFLHRSNFLELADFMWSVTEQYKDSIQFAFKPHPRLMTELYKLKTWGKEKTDAYYERWKTGENTQLETTDYSNLFLTSDALIHDCGSFTAEYLYTGNPAFFTTKDIEALKVAEKISKFGEEALNAHYIGIGENEIISFIDNVVLKGVDPKISDRERFKKQRLKVSLQKVPSQLIYEDICLSLGFAPYPEKKEINMKISIILPVYNVDCYLQDALDSLIRQTYENIEIICVDDGSTDNCPQILADYASKDNRIIIITQMNSGTLIARKTGVSAASGDYITFLDPDDWLEKNTCEVIARYAGQTGADIIQFGFRKETNTPMPNKDLKKIDEYFNRQCHYIEGSESMLRECFINERIGFNQPGKLVKKAVVKKAFSTLPDTSCIYAEDLCSGFMLFLHANSLLSIKNRLYHYRIGVGISTKRIVSFADYQKALNAFDLIDYINVYAKQYYAEEKEIIDSVIKNMKRGFIADIINICLRKLENNEDVARWIIPLFKKADSKEIALVAVTNLLTNHDICITDASVQNLINKKRKHLRCIRILSFVAGIQFVIIMGFILIMILL